MVEARHRERETSVSHYEGVAMQEEVKHYNHFMKAHVHVHFVNFLQ